MKNPFSSHLSRNIFVRRCAAESRAAYGDGSFTLVELLVVIGILAILTAAVVIVLNPAELLKQSRDSNRMTDLASMQKALQLLLSQNPSVSLGSASTVYVSLADSSSTCGSYALPTLPPGYSYRCVSSASLTLADGNGWLPVNFGSSNVQNLSRLPLDPSNNAAAGLYYTYSPSSAGAFELTALVESEKYIPQATGDGGALPGVVQRGSALDLTPPTRDNGLVGYWTLDEGAGSTAYDASSGRNNGTLTGGPAWQAASGCRKGRCLYFDGIDDYVMIPHAASLAPSQEISFMAWANKASGTDWRVLSKTETGGYDIVEDIYVQAFRKGAYARAGAASHAGWNFIAGTYDGRYLRLYLDGVPVVTTDAGGNYPITYSCTANALIIGAEAGCSNAPTAPYFNGYIDDVRVYDRTLSDAEIQAIYNATK
jgi:type II secretory pathway pseudopilin PulG